MNEKLPLSTLAEMDVLRKQLGPLNPSEAELEQLAILRGQARTAFDRFENSAQRSAGSGGPEFVLDRALFEQPDAVLEFMRAVPDSSEVNGNH